MGGVGTGLIEKGRAGHLSARSIIPPQKPKTNPRVEAFTKNIISEQGTKKLRQQLVLALDALNGKLMEKNLKILGRVTAWCHDFDKAEEILDQVLETLKPLSDNEIKSLRKDQQNMVKRMRGELFKDLRAIYNYQIPQDINEAEIKIDLGDGIPLTRKVERRFKTHYNNPQEMDGEDSHLKNLPGMGMFDKASLFTRLLEKNKARALQRVPLADIQAKVQAIWDRLAKIAQNESQNFNQVKINEQTGKRHDSARLRTEFLHRALEQEDAINANYTGQSFEDLKKYATTSSNTETNLELFQKGLIKRIDEFTDSKQTILAENFLAELDKLSDSLEDNDQGLNPIDIAIRKIKIDLATKRSLDFLREQKQRELDQKLNPNEQKTILKQIEDFDEVDVEDINRDKTEALARLVLKGELRDEAVGANHDEALIRLLRAIKNGAQSSLNTIYNTLASVTNLVRIVLKREASITEHKSKEFLGKLLVTEKAILDDSSETLNIRLKEGRSYEKGSTRIKPNEAELKEFKVTVAA